MTANRAASVLARLLNAAKARGEDYNLVLNRFALERLLYRLSISSQTDNFLLKGALLFSLWYDAPHRPTRDADLLGFGADDAESLRSAFVDVCTVEVDDGVRFDPQTIAVAAIREDNRYGGQRVTLAARIGSAKLSLQVDVGFGDAVTPALEHVTYPPLLEHLGAPKLRVYPVYTVLAEKFEAMVQLGMTNSRMKDFFDVAVIARNTELDGNTLSLAIKSTFERRRTVVPDEPPLALTVEFSAEPVKVKQWQAFLYKSRLKANALSENVALLHSLLWPPTQAAAAGQPFVSRWSPAALARL